MPFDQIMSAQIAQGGAIREQEVFVRNKKQTEGIHVKASAVPLFDENQEVVAYVYVVHDITKDKRAAIQLEQAMQQAEKSGSIDGYHF